MTDTLSRKLGRRVAALRTQLHMSQAKLADRVGTAVEVISRLERGVAIPSLRRLEEIADALGVPMRELFTFDEPEQDEVEAAIERVMTMLRRQPVERIELIQRLVIDVLKICG